MIHEFCQSTNLCRKTEADVLQLGADEYIQVVIINLSQRHKIDIPPVYMDQKWAEGNPSLCNVAMI